MIISLESIFPKRWIYFAVENFINSLVDKYSRYTAYTNRCVWYLRACNVIWIQTVVIFTIREKFYEELINISDKIESFNVYYPVYREKKEYSLSYVYNWIPLF